MPRIVKFLSILLCFSLVISQEKTDFRTKEEQQKDPKIALKKAMVFPGYGQTYNDQWWKGALILAGEVWAIYNFDQYRQDVKNYTPDFPYSSEHYISQRNRFAWIAIGLYFYSLVDAYVEAHLDNFDQLVIENDPLNTKE